MVVQENLATMRTWDVVPLDVQPPGDDHHCQQPVAILFLRGRDQAACIERTHAECLASRQGMRLVHVIAADHIDRTFGVEGNLYQDVRWNTVSDPPLLWNVPDDLPDSHLTQESSVVAEKFPPQSEPTRVMHGAPTTIDNGVELEVVAGEVHGQDFLAHLPVHECQAGLLGVQVVKVEVALRERPLFARGGEFGADGLFVDDCQL